MTVPDRKCEQPDFTPMYEIIDSHPQDPIVLKIAEELEKKGVPYKKHTTRRGRVFGVTLAAEAIALTAGAFTLPLTPAEVSALLVITSPGTVPLGVLGATAAEFIADEFTIIGGACAAFYNNLRDRNK